MRFIIRVCALSVVLSLLLAAPVGAQVAEGYSFKSTSTGTTADAYWQTCTPDTPELGLQTCNGTSVNVLEGSQRFMSDVEGPARGGSIACVGTQTWIQGPEFFEELSFASGCTDSFTFTAAADLSTAHLTATVPLTELECTETGCEPVGEPFNVAIDATWTAVGPAQTVREHGVFHYYHDGFWCKSKQSRQGLAAFATATGAIDGTDLGTAQFAQVFSGRTRFADSCR